MGDARQRSMPGEPRDWLAWHGQYDDGAGLARRLEVVQRWIRQAIADRPPGPIRVISMCAGDGRDLLGALRNHPRRDDVRGRLVELDPDLARRARETATAGAISVEVVERDAGRSTSYAGAAPADLILACGVFGNIGNADIEATVRFLPRLASKNAVVIWTRHRRPPDLTPAIRDWFEEAGFAEVAFEPIAESTASVGVHRLVSAPLPFADGSRLFEFVDWDQSA